MPAEEPRATGRPAAAVRAPRARLRQAAAAVAGIAILASIAVVLRAVAARSPERPPSIVFVMVDTLRADYLGAYGFDGPVSPNLDAFAREAVLFERAFAQAPWTKPSIASLFTSLQPETHRVVTHRGRFATGGADEATDALPAEATTLAEALRDAGYATAAFVANPWMPAAHGFAQGFDVYEQRDGLPPPAERLLRRASRWLGGRDRERPFFLYLHLMDVHGPYDAPDADYEAVRESPGLGPSQTLTAEELSRLRPYLLRARWVARDGAAMADRRTWRGRYAAGVHAVDRQLAPFLAGVEKSGILDEAIVVVAADHGEELVEHGLWDHGNTLYDTEIRVPLLVRLPGGAGGGRRVPSVVSLIDVMPTLLAQAGADPPARMQGRNLTTLLSGADGAAPHGASFAGAVKWKPAMRSLRTADWKLIRDPGADSKQLFDLAKDPGEQRDVAASEPGALARLEAKLDEHGREVAARPALTAEKAAVSDDMKKRLEALGYAR